MARIDARPNVLDGPNRLHEHYACPSEGRCTPVPLAISDRSAAPRSGATSKNPEAAVRKTAEETSITCETMGLVGIRTAPGQVIHYTSNDEVRQEFSILLTARPQAAEPTASSESSEVHWLAPEAVKELSMGRSMSLADQPLSR